MGGDSVKVALLKRPYNFALSFSGTRYSVCCPSSFDEPAQKFPVQGDVRLLTAPIGFGAFVLLKRI